MSNTVTASNDDSFAGRVKSWPERMKSFYTDVRTEMRKVTAPSQKEVQATTAVVIVTVFLFGAYFFVIDNIIGKTFDFIFQKFSK